MFVRSPGLTLSAGFRASFLLILIGLGACSANPDTACHLKRHTVLLKRYGHFGKCRPRLRFHSVKQAHRVSRTYEPRFYVKSPIHWSGL